MKKAFLASKELKLWSEEQEQLKRVLVGMNIRRKLLLDNLMEQNL